jgi:hypothetical protein
MRRHVVPIDGPQLAYADHPVVLWPMNVERTRPVLPAGTGSTDHTPGHQGLLVALPESGPLLLAADGAGILRPTASRSSAPSPESCRS